MASGLFRNVLSSVPAHLFIFQTIASSSVVGLTASASAARPLALPLVAAATYGIVETAIRFTRPRWAALLGGLSFAFLLRYIDIALITRWDYERQGPTANVAPHISSVQASKSQGSPLSATPARASRAEGPGSTWTQLAWGWDTLWSFRQTNTPFEIRNTPFFSASDPSYVPPKWPFVARQALLAGVSYLVLDLLAQRPPPRDAAVLFSPALVPFFRRLSEVTWPQIKLRAISIVMFGVTFYCVIQGAYSFAAAIAVATGLSRVRSWRPPFGAFSEAYSLRNFWGKVWHQQLRRLVSAPASYIAHNVLGLSHKSTLAIAMTTLLSFAISGIMHLAAGHASGMPLGEVGPVQFFCTQALGIMLESAVVLLLRSQRKEAPARTRPTLLHRIVGYCWVLAFLTWSGPTWLYPQAARQSPNAHSASFVPYSIVQAWSAR